MSANYRFPASCLYLLRLSRAELEAEFCHRRSDDIERFAQPRADPLTSDVLHDDINVARTTASTPSHLSGNQSGSQRFDLWRIAGHRSLEHRGDRLQLAADRGFGTIRVDLLATITHGDCIVFLLPCGKDFGRGARAATQANAVLSGRHNVQGRASRPAAQQLLLMRALIALDAHLAGASYREVAAAVFGRRTTTQRWKRDATLKEQTRYLVHKARELMNRRTAANGR